LSDTNNLVVATTQPVPPVQCIEYNELSSVTFQDCPNSHSVLNSAINLEVSNSTESFIPELQTVSGGRRKGTTKAAKTEYTYNLNCAATSVAKKY
jgi:hypothetical protein